MPSQIAQAKRVIISIGTLVIATLAVVIPLVALSWVAADTTSTEEPVGLIRAAEGTGYVESGASPSRRRAEPFVPLMADDTVVVEAGTVTVVDLRSNQEQRLGAGSKFVMPRSVGVRDSSLYGTLVATLKSIVREPEQLGIGAARGDEMRPWPNGVQFASGAYITFRWPATLRPATFRLHGPRHQGSPILYRLDNPSNSMPWPNEVPRVPGKYAWVIVGQDESEQLGIGVFEILSETAAAEKRRQYLEQAQALFSGAQKELGAELLAAKDRCFLR
jgi:hypothetical protein